MGNIKFWFKEGILGIGLKIPLKDSNTQIGWTVQKLLKGNNSTTIICCLVAKLGKMRKEYVLYNENK